MWDDVFVGGEALGGKETMSHIFLEMLDAEIEVSLRCPNDGQVTRRKVLPEEPVYCRMCNQRLTGEHYDPSFR